jgi:serine/threonine protein kinase
VLGHGGMGVVYRARQCALDRPVAVKMLLAGPFASPHELGRFRRERAALACLRHPNIVQVYDAGDVEGRPYFAMELVEGGSLARKLAGTPQPARPAAALVSTLAGAVEVAHQAGIVHRDLKPANVLLTADGTLPPGGSIARSLCCAARRSPVPPTASFSRWPCTVPGRGPKPGRHWRRSFCLTTGGRARRVTTTTGLPRPAARGRGPDPAEPAGLPDGDVRAKGQ